uniref:Calreticulin n=1 Tax=Ornithorhynchus anatinus TaxID=9258 RepID=A0A6I8N317_ORNAN
MAGAWASASAVLLVLALTHLGEAVVYFQEEFLDGDGWKKRWLQSTHDPNFGKFKLSAGKFYGDAMRDRGLQTTENSKFYAISSRFKPFSNRGKSLIIQYTVKHEQKIDCGGGYVKIFPSDVDPENLSENSYYYIMFGEFKNDLKPENTDDQSYNEDWPQSEMKNEEHVTDFNNAIYENIGVIGLELWQGREREMDRIQTKAELEKARQEEDEFFRDLRKTGFPKKDEL